MEWDNGATASMTMAAFSELVCERQTRIQCVPLALCVESI